MKSLSKSLLVFAITLTLALPTIASAQVAASTTSFLSGYTAGTLTLNVPIGQLSSCSIGMAGKPNNCLGLYIQAWYGFTLGVVGILATIMMMYAGFKYLISRGDGKAIGDAKDLMVSGITGVVLAFLSYAILSLVNPNLLVIHIPAIPTITDNSGINIGAQKSTTMGINPATEGSRNYGPLNTNFAAGFKTTLTDMETKSGIKFPTPTSGVRANDDGSLHELARAVDYPRGEPLDTYMNKLIASGKLTGYDYNGQLIYYVTFSDGTRGRIINETTNGCWHVDSGQKGETVGGKTI